MSERTFTLTEFPPSANNLHTHFQRGGKIVRAKTGKYANWRKAAIWELRSKRGNVFDGPYHLSIKAQRHWKTKHARDIDNLIKPISDAIVKAGLVKDDSLAESVQAEWSDDVTGIQLTIREA